MDEKAKKTFASALRAILRQDPDVIMIGEIRDAETAQIAFRASITGHLVLSTVHTNDAPSAITRLIDVGLQPFMVASSLLARHVDAPGAHASVPSAASRMPLEGEQARSLGLQVTREASRSSPIAAPAARTAATPATTGAPDCSRCSRSTTICAS